MENSVITKLVYHAKKHLTSGTLVGGSIFLMATILAGSGEMPSLLTMCPKNVNLSRQNSHLLVFKVIPVF